MRNTGIALIVTSVLFTLSAHAAEEPRAFTAAVNAAGVQEVEIVASSYRFEPSRIIVRAAVPLELKLRKEGGIVPHDFTLRAPEAGVDLSESVSTKARVVRVTFTKPGTYAFYCSKKVPLLGSHREKGMEGTFEVRE